MILCLMRNLRLPPQRATREIVIRAAEDEAETGPPTDHEVDTMNQEIVIVVITIEAATIIQEDTVAVIDVEEKKEYIAIFQTVCS